MAEDLSRLHALIEGRVQGVGFRMFVYEHALRMNVYGWVRNTWNGEVELTVEGPRQTLDNFLEEIRKGPRSSFVSAVHIDWQPYQAEFKRFKVRPTA